MKKLVCCLLAALLMLGTTACAASQEPPAQPEPTPEVIAAETNAPEMSATPADQVIDFGDDVLESLVREAMNRPTGDITVADAEATTELEMQQQGVDPNHPSHACSQAPQAAADDAGQSTVITAAPLRSSRRIEASPLGESCTGTNPAIDAEAASLDNPGCATPRSRIQRRSRWALIPFSSATPATEAPGAPQASIRACLNVSE